MEWTRTHTLALAANDCTQCGGLGLRGGHKGQSYPCNCVFRAIFRQCYNRFRYCASSDKQTSRISVEHGPGRSARYVWGWKDEEFVADFCLISRRSLPDFEYRIFKYHYLLGADWRLCCRKLKMDRGQFFHHVYRIQQRLGRVFRELEPYPLYPLDEYFRGTLHMPAIPSQAKNVVTMRTRPLPPRLRFPIVKVA
jgi:hypothetical protein